MTLDINCLSREVIPCVEPRLRTSKGPPGRTNSGSGRLPVQEEAGGELKQDLWLGVPSHRAENRYQRLTLCGNGRRQGVRRSTARQELRWVARAEGETEPPVVEVDPG